MASLTEIREALAENLRTIPSLDVSAYMKANPTPPSAHIFPDEIDFDQAMGGGCDDWFLLVQVFVGVVSDIGAQKRLDPMLAPAGETSVKEAIEADASLGGLVDDLQVVSCTGYRTYPRPTGDAVLGAEWRVHVLAARS